MELILSPPTTTTFLYRPLSIKLAPIVKLYKKPEHAAAKSKLQAFFAPILSQTKFAVEGKNISGVTVPTISPSVSSGEMLRFLHNSSTAGAHRSDVAFPGSVKILLSSIPVRERIHSSLVSTIFSRSALVNFCSGTYPPIAVMAAVIFWLIQQK